MHLFAVDNSFLPSVRGVMEEILASFITKILGSIFILVPLIENKITKGIPLSDIIGVIFARLDGKRYPRLGGYWINENKSSSPNKKPTYDLMKATQFGKHWRGNTIFSPNGDYYYSKAEIVDDCCLIGAWNDINPQNKSYGAFQLFIEGDTQLRGTSLEPSQNQQSDPVITESWIARKITNITPIQRLRLWIGWNKEQLFQELTRAN